MAQYRVPTVDLSTRMQLAIEMLLPAQERGWGRATALARKHGLSRTRLYQLRNEALAALGVALQPQAPGPKGMATKLTINRRFIQQAIAILPLLSGSVRGIQNALALLFGVRRSLGYISQTLQEAGQRADNYNRSLAIPLPVLGEADEIFQGRRPCLTLVDGRSFLLLNLTVAEARDETHWGVTFLDLLDQGIDFHDVAADGAKGIQAGLAATEAAIPLRPDLFHLLQEAQPISRRLERRAYQAIGVTDRAQRAAQEAATPTRRRGRPLKVKLTLSEAQAQEAEAINTYELWRWLLGEVRLALEPITPAGTIADSQAVRETLQVAVALLHQLGREDVADFADKLLAHLEELVAPLAWLEATLASWRTSLSVDDEAFITWVWQQRAALNLSLQEAFPASLQAVAQAFWEALSLFHRASSLAESLHSWVRPFLQIHRGMPQWLGPLLQLFWNHHHFQRGKRAGHSPLELAGVQDVPSLTDAFAGLFSHRVAIPAMA